MISEIAAASFIGITPRKLRRLGYERRGPFSIKIGRERIYPRDKFLAWLADLEN